MNLKIALRNRKGEFAWIVFMPLIYIYLFRKLKWTRALFWHVYACLATSAFITGLKKNLAYRFHGVNRTLKFIYFLTI
ncbi:MAG TPA: hypothetical protein DCS30_13230 [Rhizobiales bacterium]|nr:hypothetical protein [Hyphomicrobiales bacterium]